MNTKKPSGIGFSEELSAIDDFSPKPLAAKDKAESPDKIREVAQEAGFTSREPGSSIESKRKRGRPPAKVPTGPINFRAKTPVLAQFREVGEMQDPPWTLGYTLERAMKALALELSE